MTFWYQDVDFFSADHSYIFNGVQNAGIVSFQLVSMERTMYRKKIIGLIFTLYGMWFEMCWAKVFICLV